MSEWIKVCDSLPEDNTEVIAWDGRTIFFAIFIQTTDKRHKKRDGRFEPLYDDDYIETVTHWIISPELPN